MSKVYFAILLSSVLLVFSVSPVHAQTPAARITDMATSPAVIGGIPCVGGPITGPGAPTVLIENLPAARVSDSVSTACGLLIPIAKGSATVLIQNLPAARLGDTTADGGAIIQGAPMVLIGN